MIVLILGYALDSIFLGLQLDLMKGTYQGDEKLLLKAKKAHVCYIFVLISKMIILEYVLSPSWVPSLL